MQAALVWRPDLAAYDFGAGHPLDPVRVTLSVSLMREYGIPPAEALIRPDGADEAALELVHDADYIAAVREASAAPARFVPRMGLGTSDDPVFPGMHEASALVCGASIAALSAVLDEHVPRAFSMAGGLHHAHRSRAAGFCVYNDPAVAIAVARRDHPGLKVLYVDVDAHHGDGVQEAFYDSAEVMTISLHETGAYLFPGTGFANEVGEGAGTGYAANVPLPPWATDECYRLAFDGVVEPLAQAFRPDVIVAQLGVDAHHSDPLTQLGLTLPGYRWLVKRIIGLADGLCRGRLCALGGGGYSAHTVVPRAWTWVMAALAGEELPDELPESWRAQVRGFIKCEPPSTLGADDTFSLPGARRQQVVDETRTSVRGTRRAVFPHLGLTP
ncbi:MAG TPA: acetoin utilization protein AcuC [Coriobacteriia bacterium]|jgi:acetoin utilization protein AcuC